MSRDGAKYLAALLLFGSNGIVASGIALPSHQIVLLRTFLGALSLAALVVLGRGAGPLFQHPRQAGALAVSGAALGVGWLFLFEGFRVVGVGVASLAYYCGPVIVMILSPFLFAERLGAAKVAGIVSAVCGASLVVAQGGGKMDALGLLLGALSALMYAAMVTFSRRSPDIQGLAAASVQLVASFAVVAAYQLVRTLLSPAEAGETLSCLAQVDWGAVLTLGLVNTGLGCYLYFSSIGTLPVHRVAIWGYLEPLSAVALSAVALGEAVTMGRVLGAMLIVGGAMASELVGRRRGVLVAAS